MQTPLAGSVSRRRYASVAVDPPYHQTIVKHSKNKYKQLILEQMTISTIEFPPYRLPIDQTAYACKQGITTKAMDIPQMYQYIPAIHNILANVDNYWTSFWSPIGPR